MISIIEEIRELKERIAELEPKLINFQLNEVDIATSVSKSLNISIEDIRGQSRVPDVKEARFITSFLIKKYVKEMYGKKTTLSTIGKFLNKDHSTIIYHLNEVEKWVVVDKFFKAKLESVVINKITEKELNQIKHLIT